MRRLASSAKARNQARVAGVTLPNSDRVLYPQQGITKRELAEFYESIADWVLPHVVNRPLSLVRCPSGRHTDCFYQKHLTEQMPEGIGGVAIREKEKTRTYIYIQELKGLIGLVQLGVLEIHPWGCRVEDVEKPDRLVFDLDPGPGVEWPRVLEAARRLREMLRAVSLESFVKTSGGKGLHVVAPIGGIEWDDLKSFARGIVSALEHERPDRYVITMTKAHRRGKIFLDYLRNGRGATCVAAYSTRAREGATVSTPVAWEELSARLRPDMYNVRNLIRRLGAKRDPWEGFFTIRQSISPAAISAVQSLKARASPRKSKRPARG